MSSADVNELRARMREFIDGEVIPREHVLERDRSAPSRVMGVLDPDQGRARGVRVGGVDERLDGGRVHPPIRRDHGSHHDTGQHTYREWDVIADHDL